MKAINQGDNTYDIFDDSLRVYSCLPAKSYVVRFGEMRGFYLAEYVDMNTNEDKIYGVHEEKVQKVMSSFTEMNRSLGVILSGDKGIGKSLFAKMLAGKAIQSGIPVIVVDRYIKGIASYIESIEQEVMILFDEFDKTFGDVEAKAGESSPQASLLTLFDGLSGGKKLFVVTCNNLYKLSSYLVNRPGRFHYHFRFDYPSSKEIKQYLQDKLRPEYYSEIVKVTAFGCKVNLNYDCLRAIAFELNHGISFESAIADLNIVNTDCETYTVILRFTNGLMARANERFDMFNGGDEIWVELTSNDGSNIVDVHFDPVNAVFDQMSYAYVLTPDKFKVSYDGCEKCDLTEQAKASTPECIMITRAKKNSLHYAV